MTNKTIKQHYVSQCTLRKFADEKEKLYEVLHEKNVVFKTSCRNSMEERFTYEHTLLETNKLEVFFSKYEDIMGKVLIDLNETLSQYLQEKASIADIRQIVADNMQIFLLFYYKSGALLCEYEAFLDKKEDRISHLLEKILNSNYLRSLSKTISSYYKFAVIRSKEKEFLLSDQFISTAAISIKGLFSNATNRSIGFKDTIILVPITSEYYILFYDGKIPNNIANQSFNDLTEWQVDIINRVIINNSYKKTVSFKKEPLERALKHFTQHSPVGTVLKFNNGKTVGATIKKEVFFTNDIDELWKVYRSFSWSEHHKKIIRNAKCFCKSGKKIKHCCIDIVTELRTVWHTFKMVQAGRSDLIAIHPNAIVEEPVGKFIQHPGLL